MEILGKVISDKAAAEIEKLEKSLDRPVTYMLTDPAMTGSLGYCDASDPEVYKIYSKESLFNLTKEKALNVAFETNLLQQLFRAAQIAEGCPQVHTRENDTTAVNFLFYHQQGQLLAASVLELNVFARLKELGYDSDYFCRHSINQAARIARKGWKIDNEVDFSRFASQLMTLKLAHPGQEMDDLLELYKQDNPAMITLVNRLAGQIEKIGYDEGKKLLGCMAVVFTTFDLWFTHTVTYQGKEYGSYEEVKAELTDLELPDLA